MDIKQLKQEYRIRQWAEIIAECQRSGMSVKAWCMQNDIRRQTYYFWQKRVREAALANALTAQGSTSVAPTAEQRLPQTQFVQITPGGSTQTGGIALSVRIGVAECEVMNGADIAVVERTLLALGKIC